MSYKGLIKTKVEKIDEKKIEKHTSCIKQGERGEVSWRTFMQREQRATKKEKKKYLKKEMKHNRREKNDMPTTDATYAALLLSFSLFPQLEQGNRFD